MIYEAGLISFLRTIAIIVGVYLLFKLFFRYFVPFLLKLFINKQQRKYSGSYGNQDREKGKEGDININSKSSSRKSREDIGEYVEYEEVEDQDK